MNVLVLGGHGFIGSHIVEALSNTSHTLKVFARKPAEFYYDAELFTGNFLDTGKLSEALVGIDTVIHCISSTVPATSTSDPVYDIKTNLIGTVELLRLMRTQGVHRIIYFSSGGTVYGNPLTIPVPENAPLNPISSYGAVKVAIEKFIIVSKIDSEIESVILRPSNPYGERQGHKGVQGLISTVLNNAMNCRPTVIYGDGSTIRDYVYIKDVANLVCNILESERCGIYNAGSGIGFSINQVIDTIEEATGLTVLKQYKMNRGFDVKEIILDSTLAKKHFNWAPSVSLVSGIKKQFEWLEAQNGRTNR